MAIKLAIEDVRSDLRGQLAERFGKHVPSVYLALASHPDLTIALIAHFDWFRQSDSISDRQKEIVLLRVTGRRGADYEWHYHEYLSERLGFSATDREKLLKPLVSSDWSEDEAIVIRGVDELLSEDAQLSEATKKALLSIGYTPATVSEFIFLFGAYATLSSYINSIGLPRDVLPGDPEFKKSKA